VFGQVQYKLTDEISFIGGLRWTQDRKKFDSRTSINGALVYDFREATVGELATTDDGDYSFKAVVEWRPRDRQLFYAGVSRGNKGGGFNAASGGPILIEKTPFNPEVLTSYEVGSKLILVDGRVRFNTSAFYYDYNDYQAQDVIGISPFIGNYDGRYIGGEAELVITPGDGWDILLGASYLDAVVRDVNLTSGVTVDRTPPRAPKFTANGMVRKEFPLFTGTFAVQADFKYSSSSYAGISNAPAAFLPSNIVTNARITYTGADNSWDVSAFVKNLTDEEVVINAYDVTSGFGYNVQAFAPPRWFGVRLGYRW
jgi:iron complex outermembrane receptor protein